MYHKLRPGETAVQRIASVLNQATTEALELRHTLCGNKKICVRTDMLAAHLSLTKGTTTLLTPGVYVTEVFVSGKLLYQPESGCGTTPFSAAGCNPCKPCPEEDVIFASFKVYSTVENIALSSCDAVATPITYSNCQDFTNQVLITLPYTVNMGTSIAKTK